MVVADSFVGMLPTAGNEVGSVVVLEPGNDVARRRLECRVGVALNHFAQVLLSAEDQVLARYCEDSTGRNP